MDNLILLYLTLICSIILSAALIFDFIFMLIVSLISYGDIFEFISCF